MRASMVSPLLLPPGEGRDEGIRDPSSCFPHPRQLLHALLYLLHPCSRGPLPWGEGTPSGPTRAAVSRGTTAVCQPVRQRGFSLIELIIVIVVIGAIGAIAGQLLFQVGAAYNQERDIADADWQARVALERMVRELRVVRSATVADLTIAPATEITFVDANGNTVRFYRNGTTLTRSAGGVVNAQPLADDISNLTFAYFDQTGQTTTLIATEVRYIAVSLQVSTATYQGSFRTLVRPRNF